MSQELRYILAMSCIIPGIVGLCLYRKMQPQYHLLVYMMFSDATIETIVFIGKKFKSFEFFATLCSNAYILISFALYLSFVKNNGYIKNKLRRYFIVVACLFIAYNWYQIGVVNDFLLSLCFISAVCFFIAIHILSLQITAIHTRIKRNFWFWASCLFTIQYAYSFLTFGFYILNLSELLGGSNIGLFQLVVNVIYYCAFAVIMFLIPLKKLTVVHQD